MLVGSHKMIYSALQLFQVIYPSSEALLWLGNTKINDQNIKHIHKYLNTIIQLFSSLKFKLFSFIQ